MINKVTKIYYHMNGSLTILLLVMIYFISFRCQNTAISLVSVHLQTCNIGYTFLGEA